jgi:hypothetical protein
MSILSSLRRQTFLIPCTVEIEHSVDSLHAHVELDGNFEIHPGDEVLVHDAPTDVPFGEKILVNRTATIIRAGKLERVWTRFSGHFELSELYEVSFSQRRKL